MGERVAMYFAFLAHLNGHLVAPSVAGVFFFAYQVSPPRPVSHFCSM
jgi:hypothetical protein